MERLLIVNADDFGLSKGQNYGIIEACRNGVVTSTTALVNGEAIYHAAQLSRDEPTLAVGMPDSGGDQSGIRFRRSLLFHSWQP